MTEATTIFTEHLPDTEHWPDADISIGPSSILMTFIVSILAPMFLGASGGRIDFARLAAIETANAYRAHNHADLVSIAQIIGFGLAALGSLGLSMADNQSLTMTLRLRGNAVALNRSAEQNRRALQKSHADNPAPNHHALRPDASRDPVSRATANPDTDEDLDAAALMASMAAARQSAAETENRYRSAQPAMHLTPIQAVVPVAGVPITAVPVTGAPAAALANPSTLTVDQQNQLVWAKVMAEEAAILIADIDNLAPNEREHAAALTKAANELLSEKNATGQNSATPGRFQQPISRPTQR